ncbi:MAG: FkbM family methyltransferase [Terricaulis sp.]
MKQLGEFWIPDVDAEPGSNLERSRANFERGSGFQIAHLEAALRHLSMFVLAIDGGANVGSWTRRMAAVFDQVHSFEPAPEVFACLARNIADWGLSDKVILHSTALSDRFEHVAIAAKSPGRRSISSRIEGAGETQAIPIDSLNLPACSFLKLDLEGYEHRALEGASRTIAKHRPWILIENKPEHNVLYGSPDAAERYLESKGYTLVEKIGAKQIDWLYRP